MKFSQAEDSMEDNDDVSLLGLDVVLVLELRVANVQERHFVVGVIELKVLQSHMDGVDNEEGALECAEESQVFLHHCRFTFGHVHPQEGGHHVRDKVLLGRNAR